MIDKNLSFSDQIKTLTSRVKKLIFVFKQLRYVADGPLLRTVYQALCQSIISYSITCWGGAAKTHIINLERAQRILLKVALFKHYRFPTTEVYKLTDVLTVRQLYILQTILKQHSLIDYANTVDKQLAKKRLQYNVCTQKRFRTAFINKFLCFQGARLYNNLNKTLSFFHNSKSECKKILTNWLKTLTYEETEHLLKILK